ncbi:response regulator transcription factor [Janibacter melonis]|uniref:response regulator transcription factor n=1 Tax=Janibacter melonis TaxID=262209 RepID=UPI001E29BC9F|nr:response regulator transcription factor [Janibacter melonis]MCB5991386.1 response regulator transcription factor [Janibacter melonis]
MPSPDAGQPIRLAVLNDFEVVARGVAAMLAPFADRVRVVEVDCGVLVSQPVDVALYDAYAITGSGHRDLDLLAADEMVGHTVIYTWEVGPWVDAVAQDARLSGVVRKSASARELVDAVERVQAGERVVLTAETEPVDDQPRPAEWPGRAEGLTPRQSEVVALITEGLSNQEIARACYLSINSVKSYIRAAYATMGVTSRSQAVLWGVDHGFRRGGRMRVLADRVPHDGS